MSSRIPSDGEDDNIILLTSLIDEEEVEKSIDSLSITDDCYNNIIGDLQLQEIIMASLIINNDNADSDQSSGCGDSSSSTLIMFCEICTESKEDDQMFRINGCDHMYCHQCINHHVEAKLNENMNVSVKCLAADCLVELDFDSCKEIVSKEVLSKWDQSLFENSILDCNKIYCPYKDCSVMMLKDTDEVIIESECSNCWRLFCAACGVPWHSGVGCDEFQATAVGEREREDFMLRDLVKQNKWNRCPRCKFYVEKSEGCLHITCRCGFEFCYACGDPHTQTHNCQRR